MNNSEPITHDLVLIGGGHSHVSVLKHFAMKPLKGLQITLISRVVMTPYSGMLPGYLAGHYSRNEIHIDLNRLCRFCNAKFINATVNGLDLNQQTIHVDNHPNISYDVLSINTGSTPEIDSIEGAVKHTIPIKPIDEFEKKWEVVKQKIEEWQNGVFKLGVVGLGAGGVEVILALEYQLSKQLNKKANETVSVEFYLIGSSSTILPSHNKKVQLHFEQILKQKNIKVFTNFQVKTVSELGISNTDNQFIALNNIVWVTSASAPKWPKHSGLAVDSKGFISVNNNLQSISHFNVFSVGDVASMVNNPRPKSGVFAVRQGLPLARNLRNVLCNKPLTAYHPQQHFLSLLSGGSKTAVMSWGQWCLTADWIWHWKNWIDQRFMQRFNNLKPMSDKKFNIQLSQAATVHCAGCGSKIGSQQIRKVLNDVKSYQREGILTGIQDDDAAILKWPNNKLQIQSIDGFKSLINNPYIFSQIVTEHALNDIYAMGAEPYTALAMITVPYGSPEKLEDTLKIVLKGILQVLNKASVSLIGGHSNQGTELSIALSVTGSGTKNNLWNKKVAAADQVLILTKPIGTGTLFAADMQLKSHGEWIINAVESMLLSNAQSIDVFRKHKVQSCTDITGFGLAGHLQEMVSNTDFTAEISLKNIPILNGSIDCIHKGIESTLAPVNKTVDKSIISNDKIRTKPHYKLLFDPQTSGGLLAAVPKHNAQYIIQELQALGYSAKAIGKIIERTNQKPYDIFISE